MGSNRRHSQKAYNALLSTNGIRTSENADDLEITGKIATYVPVVIDGNSHVYFTLEGDKTVYDADLTNSEIVGIIAYKEGDSISMFYQDGDTTSNVTKIK